MCTSDKLMILGKEFSKESYSDLSSDSNDKRIKGKSLIESDKKDAYNYDEIVKFLFGEKNTPSSADALLIDSKNNGIDIKFIEFKTGFQRKISLESFDSSECTCPYDSKKQCDDYAELSKKNLKKIEDELKGSIRTKAIESKYIFKNHLLPLLPDCIKNDKKVLRYELVVVVDKVKENPVDFTEQIRGELGSLNNEDTQKKDNYYDGLNKSLKRLSVESKNGKNAYYEKACYISVEEFKADYLS